MNNFYWLVRREFWEHRGAFLWTPIIAAAVIVAINILIIIAGEVTGSHGFVNAAFWHQVATAPPADLRKLGAMLDFSALVPMFIISIALFFVLFSYCMKTLSTDRADRSILFWKSLPVSDLATVISKAFSAVVLVPVIATIVGVLGAVAVYLVLAITGAFHGISFIEAFWVLPHPGQILLVIVGTLPIFMIWMLPAVGWLMLCSAWSSGKVARWAIALPFGAGAIVAWLSLIGPAASWGGWFWTHIVLRVILGVFPGSWLLFGNYEGANFNAVFGHDNSGWRANPHINSYADMITSSMSHQYQYLITPDFLWGILAGFGMIAVAIWLRRWRTEL
jgi:ABC-2 type transport system permease protein